MGWEQRRGQKFYYESVCVDGVHRKRYVGKGAAAESLARQINEKQQRRTAERQAVADEQARTAPADKAIAELQTLVGLLFRASLILDGYRQHHREWRRRRVKIDHDCDQQD